MIVVRGSYRMVRPASASAHLATRPEASRHPMILPRGAVLTMVMTCSWKYYFSFLAVK